jgi:isopentenyldiphosphate isomerase/intracellular septation protein A
MSKFQLLKKLLPGLLPLLVFILVDEIYGTEAGLIVAVCFGVAELIFTYIRNKEFDKFTLFDTLLIVILGIISYLLENDTFFKLKPALVGVILCILLGISAFTKLNIFGMMSKRYFGDISFSEEQMKAFRNNLKILFFLFLFHTLLVFYSAFFMSKEAWAFISTVLFYLIFAAFLLFEIIYNKIKNLKYKKEEWLPLIDEKGNITGKAPRTIVHRNKDMLHPVVHLVLSNSKRQIYLQKRAPDKQAFPDKWDASVTGHVSANESVDTALMREADEEIGLKNFSPTAICNYILKTDTESEMVLFFHTKYDGEIHFNHQEISEGKFWNISDIKKNLGKGIFTPGFEIDFNVLIKNSLI